MTETGKEQDVTLAQRIAAIFWPPDNPIGARTFAKTLLLLLVLVIVYVIAHWWTLANAKHLHTEGSTVDAERMALLLDTADLEDALLTPPAIASPAVKAVLNSLEESVTAATDAETVNTLFSDVIESLVNLGIPADETQPNRDSATARITEYLKPALDQAVILVVATEDDREVPRRLLEVELEQAEAAVLNYMAAPALITRINELKEAARGLGYSANSDVLTTLNQIAEELEKDFPNRDLAAEKLNRIDQAIQGLRTSLFWSHPALFWLEVIAWSLAGILVVRLFSAGKFIGIGQYKGSWDRWWWAKIVSAPFLAIVVVGFLKFLTVDVQSGETLGIKISLKGQPIEVVIAFAFVIGMFNDQAYKYLQGMANLILPEDDETEDREKMITVEDEPIRGRSSEAVKEELEAKGFKVLIETIESTEGEPGAVLERRPADKKLKKGEDITLFVVKNPGTE